MGHGGRGDSVGHGVAGGGVGQTGQGMADGVGLDEGGGIAGHGVAGGGVGHIGQEAQVGHVVVRAA